MQKVAFQGDLGSYSQEASHRFFPDEIEPVPQTTFAEVFDTVESGKSNFGIVPIENSLVGSIHQNYDLLLKHNLKVIGEQNLRIIHTLIANPGVALKDITEVYSHPVALDQCKHYLDGHKQLKPIPGYDTAGSVKILKDKKSINAAAIAGRFAADFYSMNILAEGIQDEPENYTRFLILSKHPAEQIENCKTSIVFALKNLAGVLFKALSVFALRDIDLTKIESRPLRKRTWEYYFYLDFVGHINDEASKNAIAHLREITTFLKILGSYPISDSQKQG